VTQKNALLDVIEKRGLRPAEFNLTVEKYGITYIRHQASDSFFSLASTDGVNYQGETKIGAYGPHQYGQAFWAVILNDLFPTWAYNLKIEIQTPDMWRELRNSVAFLGEITEDVANTPFADAEVQEISTQLNEIKLYIIESRALSEEQTAKLEARFDEAEQASRRMGRKDWILLFGGTLLTLVLSAVVPPEIIVHIISMTADGLGHLFGGAARPELPPQG
jgi:hypothetical protein